MLFAIMCESADCGQQCFRTWKIPWRKTQTWANFLPGDSVDFLSLDEVLVVHEQLIKRFGGAVVIRQHGLLESALFRPQTGYYTDLVSMATLGFDGNGFV